jgi:putative ABC transport system permease protein
MRIPLLKGRQFTEQDRQQTPRVVVVNDAMARRFWPNDEAVGKRIGFRESDPQVWHTIVGVVGDVKHRQPDADPKPELYFPYGQYPRTFISLVVRASSDPANLAAAIRNQVLAIDGDQPVFDVRTMEERLSKTVAPARFITLLLGLFAAIAAILAGVGIYGVISYSVSQRTHEIGVRMALGASSRDVMRLIVRQGMITAAVGIAAGLAAAFAMTKLMKSLLYEISATDPATFAIIPALVAVVALAACLVPARRATRVDPMEALRYE